MESKVPALPHASFVNLISISLSLFPHLSAGDNGTSPPDAKYISSRMFNFLMGL